MRTIRFVIIGLFALQLSGCGLYTPTKDLSHSEVPDSNGISAQGEYERTVFAHIGCELATGLFRAQKRFELPWLEHWGTAITLMISAQDQGGFNPGLSIRDPIRNFAQSHAMGGTTTIQQVLSVGLGASISTSATRAETVQVTWRNKDLLLYGADIFKKTPPGQEPCDRSGIQIDGNLKLSEFIYDKAQTANSGELNPALFVSKGSNKWPVFNTLTDEIVFLASFGGSITPTVNMARITANTGSSLLAAQRTYTNDLIITIGEIAHQPSPSSATSLGPAAQNQHNAKVNASAIATSIRSQGL